MKGGGKQQADDRQSNNSKQTGGKSNRKQKCKNAETESNKRRQEIFDPNNFKSYKEETDEKMKADRLAQEAKMRYVRHILKTLILLT